MTWRPPKTPAHYFPSFPAARTEHKPCFPLKEKVARGISLLHTELWPDRPGQCGTISHRVRIWVRLQSDRVAIRPLYHAGSRSPAHLEEAPCISLWNLLKLPKIILVAQKKNKIVQKLSLLGLCITPGHAAPAHLEQASCISLNRHQQQGTREVCHLRWLLSNLAMHSSTSLYYIFIYIFRD